MNLIEFSQIYELEQSTLFRIAKEEFNTIILSEYLELPEKLQRQLEEYLLIDSSKVINSDLFYTAKLINYCYKKEAVILIDTCSLLDDSFDNFYRIFQNIRGEDQKLHIPYLVIEELKQLTSNPKKGRKVQNIAASRLEFILNEVTLEKIDIVGSEDDKRKNSKGEKKIIHADRVLLEKLLLLRNDSRTAMLITQDHAVTQDALSLNNTQSVNTYSKILVKKIKKDGSLIDNSSDCPNPKISIDS